MVLTSEECRQILKQRREAFTLAREAYKQATGKELCDVIREGLKNMPDEIEELVGSGEWMKVRTEVNRMLGYASMVGECRRVKPKR